MSLHEIVFEGQVLPGHAPETVRQNLARVFQADTARLDKLFSGRRLVLKTGLDTQAAEKYREVLERAGARVQVNALQVPVEADWAASPEPAPERAQVVPRDEYMAAFAGVDAPDYGIAEAGATMAPAQPARAAPLLDLSGLSIAPAGSDLGQAKAAPAPAAPDTSHLKLSQ
ncbi:hypothetical protein [Pseudomonas sp. KNUC1026]|uniref:hypothetical protein n=1 Tax=Pseudomonas sp. KNUC1026 TaxID=2893890 RepID=UPI001F1B55E7|nr:hypothetical protein [Pseudomonas sp. KNUC1026]UFH50872.1 hypothetical protein LN139_07090 [Pseudomonas sp. KNUC1026]